MTLAAVASIGAVTPPVASAGPVGPSWSGSPTCDVVRGGDGALSYTTDGGATITPTSERITPVSYTHVTALPGSDNLVGIVKHTIQRSTDSGCTWRTLSKVPENIAAYDVFSGDSDVAYVVGINQQSIYVVRGERVIRTDGPVPHRGVVGFAVDPADAQHVRAADRAGQLYESLDGARTWNPVGHVPAATAGSGHTAAFDPDDLDHVVLGCGRLSFVTFDGGDSWRRIQGLSEGGTHKSVNLFSAAVSPVDSRVVWAEGYDPDRSGNAARRIYRSTDGGRTFVGVLDGTDVSLINGTNLYPDPTDPDVLHFAYGAWFGGYGTDLYRLDVSLDRAASRRLTWQHNDHDGIDSIAFDPTDPSVMYLGLREVR